MKKAIFSLKITALLSASLHAQQTEDKIYHYSSMDALRNGVYTGDITVKELKEKSDFGLGTYNFLDGELIQLDGQLFRVATDGSVETASEKRQVPFGSFTFFRKDQSIMAEQIKTVAELQQKLVHLLPSRNRFYAIKIEAGFENLTLGGAVKVSEKDTTGIATFMKTRPQYKKQNIRGTLVGFYSPPYVGGLDLSPFHFHFISDDKTAGGHLIDGTFSDTKITIQLDEKSNYEVILPHTNNEGYQRNWKTSEAKAQY
ncbi:alpha-acetolactate decarboxylase [Chryseobacterium angstadtii]|uniref:Alpha-acetolactate decarboxylase n=1 Tax=Chryseobacterium angstadtii TaxID=558151 RepID=A0A0J7I6E9_9FLAO|nr:acetolactate decarboxylase [Chryseobacterium angstadtii]KMQ61386.1 alpha-acetolactate decarboxylase [Chryseobacterium angstadtii]